MFGLSYLYFFFCASKFFKHQIDSLIIPIIPTYFLIYRNYIYLFIINNLICLKIIKINKIPFSSYITYDTYVKLILKQLK